MPGDFLVSDLLRGGQPTLSLFPAVAEPILLKPLRAPREKEEGFSVSSFTGATSSCWDQPAALIWTNAPDSVGTGSIPER